MRIERRRGKTQIFTCLQKEYVTLEAREYYSKTLNNDKVEKQIIPVKMILEPILVYPGSFLDQSTDERVFQKQVGLNNV